MPLRLVAAGVVICLSAAGASADPLAARIAACRGVIDGDARLACYDTIRVAADLKITGAGSAVTDLFEVPSPRLLRFTSDDAIMVVYLLDEAGSVVQNLHRGGAGEGRHLIDAPGRYRVQVNATGGWSLRLETPPTAD